MKPLRVGLLGLSERGQPYLEAIRADERLDLVAMADINPETRRRFRESSTVPIYEDYRLMVTETLRDGLELLIIALPPFQACEIIGQGVIRNTSILLTAPFARTAEEAQQILKHLGQTACCVMVSSQWRYEPVFRKLDDLCELLGHPYSAHAIVQNAMTESGWRGDKKRAGGGVLLYGGYDTIDLLIHVFGPVVTAYTRTFSTTPLGTLRNYDTEDAATVSFSFRNDRHASLTLARGITPATWQVILLGSCAQVELKPGRLTLQPRDGRKSKYYRAGSHSSVVREIEALITGVVDPKPGLGDEMERHVSIMNAIEAAYLSAATGQPESLQSMTL